MEKENLKIYILKDDYVEYLRKVDEKCLKCDKYYNNNLPGYKKCNHGCIVLDYLLSKKYNQNSLEGSVLA